MTEAELFQKINDRVVEAMKERYEYGRPEWRWPFFMGHGQCRNQFAEAMESVKKELAEMGIET